jgi:prepilin-type N-terminal cleavage/methylation domain-containing protein
MNLNKNKTDLTSNQKGFTIIELVVAAGVLGAVAYLVLPFVFPSDSKSSAAYLEEDLSNISQVIDLRTQTAKINNTPIDEIYIGNLGVFSARSQISHAITLDPVNNELTYCLRGDYRGETLYYESFTGLSPMPSGSRDCPGTTIDSQEVLIEEAPIEEVPTETIPTEEPSN